MKKSILLLLFPLCLLLAFTACSDDDEGCKEVVYAIKKVETVTSKGLDNRTDWKFMVGGYVYNHAVVGNKLTATPKSRDETFFYSEYFGNNCMILEIGVLIRFHFVSPQYYELHKRLTEDIKLMLDQRTPQKLSEADILVSEEYWSFQPEYADVELSYAFDLLDFNFIDLPEGTEVKIVNGSIFGQETLPLVVDGNYKFVTEDFHDPILAVQVAGKIHSFRFRDMTNIGSRGYHHTFSIRYNKDAADETKVLTVENLKSEVRSLDSAG